MNVADLLTEQNIPFTHSGKDYLVSCFNPDHEDSNPSMRIDKVLGIFHCLACGYKGNLFNRFGRKPDKLETLRERLMRKIKDIRQDSIGQSFPKDMIPYIGNWRNISSDTYRKFEAFKSAEKEYINRVVFPIRDITGKIVCFLGRDDTGTLSKKYYIHPGGVRLPFFPSVTPIKDRVVIVEGIFDMLNLYDKGVQNVIVTFGTSTIMQDGCFDYLKLQGVTGIDILFDSDDAGKKAAEKAKEIIEKSGLDATIRNLPSGMDPGDLVYEQVQKLKEALHGKSSDS